MRRMIPTKMIEWIKSIRKSDNKIDSSKLDKKLYYHPITIVSNEAGEVLESRIQMLILDNNSNAYDVTSLDTKLKALMDGGAIININGYFKNDSTIFNAYIFQKVGDNYNVYGNDTTGRNSITLDKILRVGVSVFDGVNQIYPN